MSCRHLVGSLEIVMGNKARCKFRLVGATPNTDGLTLNFSALYDENDPEDTKFSQHTPWGDLQTHISNPNVMPMFKNAVGQDFYIDISPVAGSEQGQTP